MQRVDLRGYDAATEQRCPVCSTESALSVRGSQSIACRKCAFVGDIIHLYAAAKRVDLDAALTELKYHGLVSFRDPSEEAIYRSDATEQAKLQRILARGRQLFRDADTTVRGILGAFDCWYGEPTTAKAALNHGYLRQSFFEEEDFEFPKEAKEARAWWKLYGVVAIPVYAAWKIVGFWLIRARQSEDTGVVPCEVYLPLVLSEGPGMGYAHTVAVGTPDAFVVDSALIAMRYHLRQVFDGVLETPFVVPEATHRVDLACLGESQPIFYTPTLEPEWFYRATETSASRIVFFLGHEDLGFMPTMALARKGPSATMSRTIVNALRARGRPAHEAYARLLLSKKPSDAKRIFSAHPLSAVGQSRCFQAVSGEDTAALARIFERGVRVRTVDIDTKVVIERDEGWFHGDTLISDVTFQITELTIDGAATRARGHVQYRRQIMSFEVPYDQIRKGTKDWLEDFVIAQPGQGIPVINSAWSSKLLRIATSLQEPRRVLRGTSYGWGEDGKALFMPYFIIRAEGITGTEHAVMDGPRIQKPIPLTSDGWNVVRDNQACQILLALIGNLLRTQAALPGYGIAVRSSPHVVEAVARALEMPVIKDPRPDRLERGALSPLPMPVIWTDDGLAEACNSGVPLNVLMSVDPSSHRLLKLHKNWLCLETTDFSWGESIGLIFTVLRDLLWVPNVQAIRLEAEHLFMDLAERLHGVMVARGISGDVFQDAARELGKSVNHQGNAGFSILLFLQWAQDRGLLTAVPREDLMILKVAEIRAALANPLTPRADLEVLARQLVACRYLTLNRGGEWGIPADVWGAAASFYSNK